MGCHTECINFFLYIALEQHSAVISSRFWDDLTHREKGNSELLDGCDYPHTYKLLYKTFTISLVAGYTCIRREFKPCRLYIKKNSKPRD